MAFFNKLKLWWKKRKLINCLYDEALDVSLELLLHAMRLFLIINKPFSRNIEKFEARYSFTSQNERIDVGVIFADGKMTVKPHPIDNTNVAVVFKNGKAVKEFLFSDSPDIIGAILNGDVSYTGNLNYLSKFAYMAKSMKMQFLPAK